MRRLEAGVLAGMACLFAAASVLCADPPVKGARAAAAAEHHHPQNWRFTLPRGDAARGRAVFSRYECYSCHQVRGDDFPEPTESAPELSQMGPLHPAEFFAESIVNPNAVVSKEYRNSDGTSPMTDFTEKMTLREWIDVSAYVASLKPPAAAKSIHGVGKIVALMPQAREIVIDHERIPDVMDAMTMGYKVESAAALKGLRSGDRVEFTLDVSKRVITKIEKRRN